MAESMSLFREQLVLRALAALCEVTDECGKRPAAKSLSLRFILAYTFIAAGGDAKHKWLWDSFWENATAPLDPRKPMDAYLRGTGAQSALNGICHAIGYRPDADFLHMLREHRRVRTRTSEPPPIFDHANDEPSDDNAA